MQFLYKWPESLKTIVDYLVWLKTPHSVKIYVPKRSDAQSDYWYWYVDLIKDYTGYTKEQTKMILKKWVTQIEWVKMYETIVTKKGIQIDDYRSSADLNKEEFSLLMKYTMEVCDQMGIQYKYDAVQFANEIFN